MSIIVSDRYGGNWPDPETVCDGDCDGMGRVPILAGDPDPFYFNQWRDLDAVEPSTDGFHFGVCKHCRGTGKRALS